MAEFVPPFPPRPAKPLSIVDMLQRGSANFLTIFEEQAYKYHTMSLQALTRQVFICNSPDAIAEAFVQKHENFAQKGPQLRSALAPLLGDGLTIADGQIWAARRAAMDNAITKYRRHHMPAVLDAVEQLEAEWGEQAEVDLVEAMPQHAARMLGRMLFGSIFTDDDVRVLRTAIAAEQARTNKSNLKHLVGLGLPSATRIKGERAGVLAGVHALFDRLIGAVLPGESSLCRVLKASGDLDPVALRNELIALFLGGYESVASLLTWAFYLQSEAPEVEQRLLAEIDSVIGRRTPEVADLKALVLVRALASETMRLYPPVPLLIRQARRADTICGRKVSAKALVVVVPWLLHRHQDFWDDPDTFRPDRFMPDAARKVQRYAYVPFSTGPRECPAALLGLSEAVITLALLLQRYRFRLKPQTRVEPVGGHTILPGAALPMRVSRRSAVVVVDRAAAPAQLVSCL